MAKFYNLATEDNAKQARDAVYETLNNNWFIVAYTHSRTDELELSRNNAFLIRDNPVTISLFADGYVLYVYDSNTTHYFEAKDETHIAINYQGIEVRGKYKDGATYRKVFRIIRPITKEDRETFLI